MTTVDADKITAIDLSQVVMLNSYEKNNKKNFLSNQDLLFQEERRKRKVRRLNFEER